MLDAAYWTWMVFIFAFGCCIGSFLNVVIYRLPLEKSLVRPGSSCPSCGYMIRFFDNIPIFSWLILRGRCRKCKAKISPRYLAVELFTGILFAATFQIYFFTNLQSGMVPFEKGGWLIWVVHITLLAAFIAASAIDMELWIIPLGICWFVTAAGIIASGVGPVLIDFAKFREIYVLPMAGAVTGSLSAGAAVGLAIALFLLYKGVVKRSYETENEPDSDLGSDIVNEDINHRREVCKEIMFLLPVVVCSAAFCLIFSKAGWWQKFSQVPLVSGVLGSLWGYFIGCAVVWATRIFGTLLFGREAMGLGDVHLMGAAGAVIGAVPVTFAFFIAPFFGLAWALSQMFFKKTREIPYGPFLSLGVFTVMILFERIYAVLFERLFILK